MTHVFILYLILILLLVAILILEMDRRRATIAKFGGHNAKFPFRNTWDTERHLRESFERIRQYELHIVPREYTVKNMPNWTDWNYKGQPALIEVSAADYDTMTWISDWFIHKQRLECKRYDEHQSPLEWFATARYPKHLSGKKLADFVYKNVKGCGNFRSYLATGFIKYFGAKSMLDPSSGWGDRLIGAMAAGIDYQGVDPNTALQLGYRAMINEFGDPQRHNVAPVPFEEFTPTREYDLVLTSPPYFNLEIYSAEETQSTARYTTENRWYEDFLLPYLRKAFDALRPGGHMIIIINDVRGETDYVSRMVADVSKFANYLGVMAYAEVNGDHIRSPQPVWIWSKAA